MSKDWSNNNELLKAIQNSDVESVRKYMKEGIGEDGTILHYVVRLGNFDVVKVLLESGAKRWINSFDDVSLTPLAWAAKTNNRSLMELLIEAGVDVNLRDEPKIGNTALREVVEQANYETVLILVKAGADPRIPGWMQLTALDKSLQRLEGSKDSESQKIHELLEGSKQSS